MNSNDCGERRNPGPRNGPRRYRSCGWLLAVAAIGLTADVEPAAQATTTEFRRSRSVPTQWIRSGMAKAWRITSVAGSGTEWTVVMSRRSGFDRQTYRVRRRWPSSPWRKCVSLSRQVKWLEDGRLGR